MLSQRTSRDRSAPMDIDPPELHKSLEALALPQGYQDGPARKRLHAELNSDLTSHHPVDSTPHRPLRFGTNTPFLFHLNNPPPQPSFRPFGTYNPSDWASSDFGFSQGQGPGERSVRDAGYNDLGDIDMAAGHDSPLRSTTGKERAVSEKEEDTHTHAHAGSENGTNENEPEEVEVRPIAMGGVVRERKRRQRNPNSQPRRTEHQHHYNFHVPAPALRHSEIPSLLLGYLQFLVNAAIVFFVLYLAVQFVLTVRQDVHDRMSEVSTEILQEIAECSHLYLTNRCDPTLRVPAMEAPCKAWEACMQRDPTMVGRVNVVAETFAGVINSFVDPISWKTMGFTLVTLSFLVILTNSALFNLRARTMYHPPPPPQNPYGLGMPHQGYLQQGHTQPYQQQQHHGLAPPPGPSGFAQPQAQIGWDEGNGKKGKKGWFS
ncbi:Di-sulfide bridge nucleocytoplasmic transport domain-domain-containing protein [Naematelia encephala]|uniref:Di-sulfide bridge nucleocytoplasmic transport domain-domain-containing protein n=1 Tax=Naematelia encephala TaxID=71784 RepID=A0A1Y2BIW9_9TREE|nr:Di-sulfide bridge nucleocytoplasmic transport domain-domain-containing protein [Naematelia encephala]